FAPQRHDGNGRIPEPACQPEFPQRLSRARRDLERPRATAERPARTHWPPRSRRQFVVDLDGAVYKTVALQLDVPVLPARRGAGAHLGVQRPAYFPPELYG